jgi:hypothetical protein
MHWLDAAAGKMVHAKRTHADGGVVMLFGLSSNFGPAP